MRMMAVLAAIGLAACADPTDLRVRIESDVRWSGDLPNGVIDGNGYQVIDLPDEGRQCVRVQKITPLGFLRVRIEWGSMSGPSGSDWDETTLPYGSVSACSGS